MPNRSITADAPPALSSYRAKGPTMSLRLADLSDRLPEAPDRRWNLLLACVAGYLLMSVARIHQVFPALTSLRLAWVTGGLAVLLYILDRSEHGRLRHVFVPTTMYLVALLVWMTLSVPGSLWVGNSFDLVYDNFAKTLLMYVVLVGAIRGLRDVERLAAVYWIGAVIYAVVVIQRFEVGGGGDTWRLDNLYYYDANEFATFAVAALPLGMHFVRETPRTLFRVLGSVCLAVLALAFAYAGSRGGYVAFFAVVVFVVLRHKGIPLRWRLSGTLLVGLIVVAATSDRFWDEIGTIATEKDYNVTEEAGRLNIWRRGIGYMLQYPVLGVGPNNFAVAEGTLSPQAHLQQLGIGVRWSAAHNSFIQIGAELGIPGLMLFVALIASAFRALRSRRNDGALPARARDLGHALAASLVGFLVGAFFLSLAYSEMLYMLIALAVGLGKATAGQFHSR